MLITSNDVLGTWAVDWQVALSALQGMPQQSESGIEITLAKATKRNIFGNATNVKQIECGIESARVRLVLTST